MKRTSAGVLIVAFLIGGVVGFGIDQLLTGAGRATFTPSPLPPVLPVPLGAATVASAPPIRRAIMAAALSIDLFRAVRVAMLASASSVVGAVLAGIATDCSCSRSPGRSPCRLDGGITTAGSLVLLVAALVAEHLCTIRKDDHDEHPGPDEPRFGLSHND
ncbi:MAG: DUF3180 family protein [Microbacterium sp.]